MSGVLCCCKKHCCWTCSPFMHLQLPSQNVAFGKARFHQHRCGPHTSPAGLYRSKCWRGAISRWERPGRASPNSDGVLRGALRATVKHLLGPQLMAIIEMLMTHPVAFGACASSAHSQKQMCLFSFRLEGNSLNNPAQMVLALLSHPWFPASRAKEPLLCFLGGLRCGDLWQVRTIREWIWGYLNTVLLITSCY